MRETSQIEFSNHALNQMKERNIPMELVKKTLEMPHKLIIKEQRVKATIMFRKRRKKYLCIVVYEEMNEMRRVITAFITSKINKYI